MQIVGCPMGARIVFYNAPVDSGEVNFAVRPIVRVKMGRRVVSDSKQALCEAALKAWRVGYGRRGWDKTSI